MICNAFDLYLRNLLCYIDEILYCYFSCVNEADTGVFDGSYMCLSTYFDLFMV